MGSAAGAANQTGFTGGPGFDTGTSILSTAGWLAFVLGVIFLVYWLLKRFGPSTFAGGGRGALRLEERVLVGNQQSICVVKYKERTFLVGATNQSIRLLADLDKQGLSGFEEALSQSVVGDGEE
ncbi:flagellar biosynthetic protein FliO [Salidesulfovibrio brasiliensis]|uniref:flagellar biosynthetic protein FliO n=1 Tax=Salidesulfovibrio brasiliensis TaxID=221711 RepID=UPI0006D16E6A|nr:flagellar biosynthetic protein FliO [Salidesulfovibrio brasiliensis]